jgi:hypothetical protein
MQQQFLQHPQAQQHTSLLMQQQQHLQAVQQHIQAQQQLLNNLNSVGAMQVLPQLWQHAAQHPAQNPHTPANSHQAAPPQPHDGQAVVTNPPQAQDNQPFAPVQMEEFPFPVFSSTILEEVNQFKPTPREEKKPGEAEEQVFFFGGNTGAANMIWNNNTQPQAEVSQLTQQQQLGLESLQDQLRASGLTSSALLQQTSLPLLFQMPQLTGLEEDDKWILSLLNIDGVSHVENPNPNPNPANTPGF